MPRPRRPGTEPRSYSQIAIRVQDLDNLKAIATVLNCTQPVAVSIALAELLQHPERIQELAQARVTALLAAR